MIRRLLVVISLLAVGFGGPSCGDDGPELKNGNGTSSEDSTSDDRDAGPVDGDEVQADSETGPEDSTSGDRDVGPVDGDEMQADSETATDGDASCPEPDDTQRRSCSPLETCPAPDSEEKPQIVCHEPQVVPAGRDSFELEFHGRHLVSESGGTRLVEIRDKSAPVTTTSLITRVEIVSECHLRVDVDVEHADWFRCGRVAEARVVRKIPDEGDTEASDWRDIQIIRGRGDR